MEEKWDVILKSKTTVSQEFHRIIEHQRMMCSNIIRNKDTILAELQVRSLGFKNFKFAMLKGCCVLLLLLLLLSPLVVVSPVLTISVSTGET